MKQRSKSCPSATLSDGAILLGVINTNGSVGFITNPVELTGELFEEIKQQQEPEKRYRFSSACVETGCHQWQNGGCSVIKKVMHANEDISLEQQLPDCSIRKSCRWYFQEGAKACSFCPYIITDMLEKRKEQGMV
jgi:hypothetical protein